DRAAQRGVDLFAAIRAAFAAVLEVQHRDVAVLPARVGGERDGRLAARGGQQAKVVQGEAEIREGDVPGAAGTGDGLPLVAGRETDLDRLLRWLAGGEYRQRQQRPASSVCHLHAQAMEAEACQIGRAAGKPARTPTG